MPSSPPDPPLFFLLPFPPSPSQKLEPTTAANDCGPPPPPALALRPHAPPPPPPAAAAAAACPPPPSDMERIKGKSSDADAWYTPPSSLTQTVSSTHRQTGSTRGDNTTPAATSAWPDAHRSQFGGLHDGQKQRRDWHRLQPWQMQRRRLCRCHDRQGTTRVRI